MKYDSIDNVLNLSDDCKHFSAMLYLRFIDSLCFFLQWEMTITKLLITFCSECADAYTSWPNETGLLYFGDFLLVSVAKALTLIVTKCGINVHFKKVHLFIYIYRVPAVP